MKLVNRNAKANLILSRFVFCAMIIFLYACGSGGGGDDTSSGTGSVSFGLALQDQGTTVQALNSRAAQAFQAFNILAAVSSEGQFECKTETYQITSIEAEVVDENDEFLAQGGPFDCEDHQGDISGVEAGDNRKVKVSAKDSDGVTIFDGASEPFAVVAGEVTDAGLITLLPVGPLPLPPTGVTATAGIGQITLNWLPVADAATYNVYFSTSPGVSKDNFEGVFRGIGQTSFIHSNLAGGDSFFYVVTAQNDVGESDESAEVSATVPVNARLIGDFIGTGFGFGFDVFNDFVPFTWTGLFNAGFDGSGGGTFEDIATSDESPESGTLTYNLDLDGSLTSTLSDGTVFDGILNADNNILAVVDTDFTEDEFIEMDVAIKKSTGLTSASLNGEYIGVRISDVPSTALTTTTFDGNGRGTFEFLADSDDPSLDSGTFAYSVDSDGDVTISVPGAVASAGIVSGDGTVVSLVDTDFRGGNEDIDMTVLIKTSSGLSNASLSGDYVAVSFGFNPDPSFPGSDETARTKIISDGAGNMRFETLSSSSETVDTPFSATYNVDDQNGRFTINLPNEETLEGIVNSKGDVFTFVNTNPNAQFIEMGVAIRKTP